MAGYLKLSTRQLVLWQLKRADVFIKKAEKDPTFELRAQWPMVGCCLGVEFCVVYWSTLSQKRIPPNHQR